MLSRYLPTRAPKNASRDSQNGSLGHLALAGRLDRIGVQPLYRVNRKYRRASRCSCSSRY